MTKHQQFVGSNIINKNRFSNPGNRRAVYRAGRYRGGRRRGVAFAFVALGMLVLLGMTGLVIDIGHLHMKEAQAMRAADAAALAGAMELANSGDSQAASDKAKEYSRRNGYDPAQANVSFRGGVDPERTNWYTVSVSRPEPLFFISALNVVYQIGHQRTVGATATAEFLAAVPIDIKLGGGVYGATGPINLTMYGPHSEYQHGDPYSPRWIDDNATPNPDNVGFDGYDFELFVPADYSTRPGNSSFVNLEIFDPDTYNVNGDRADGITNFDEIRQPYNAPTPQPDSIYTTTRYQIYKVIDPADPSKDQLIAESSYRDDATADQKWVTPNGFSFDTNTYGTGAYRLNIKTLDGSSENGFDLRAGPPRADGQEFNKDNGTKITATGRIPINFNQGGLTTITLGEVPTEAAGGDLIIEKFDTDVGSKSVVYTSDPPASNQPAGGWPGILSANAQWNTDDPIRLPADYKTATWYATYVAGQQDTSLWKMSYSNTIAGKPGSVKLVGRAGKPY